MKYVLFALMMLASTAMSWFSTAPARAGFELIVDQNTLQKVNGIWEIDVKIRSVGTPTTIYSLLLNLRLFPADGQPINTLDGISFVGITNPTNSPLFASAEVNADVPIPHIMPGSLVSPVEVSAPAAEKIAFTVRFISYREQPTGVRVGFMDVGNFYQISRSEGPAIYNFSSLLRSPDLTITAVPEPSSCVLAGGLLAAIGWRARRRHRNVARRAASELLPKKLD